MPPVEMAGTLSTFGEQVSSKKPSNPRATFGSSTRNTKVYEKAFGDLLYGTQSAANTYEVKSGFGDQLKSQNFTSPKYGFGIKPASDQNLTKQGRPGPGTYTPFPHAVGKQVDSRKNSEPAWIVGRNDRFMDTRAKDGMKEDFKVPFVEGDIKPTAGWMGDAPGYTFSCQAKRSQYGILPGDKQTKYMTPAPVAYEKKSAFGSQVSSTKPSQPVTRVGRSKREATQRLYISAAHERNQVGRHSPGPAMYQGRQYQSSLGQQVTSKRRNGQNMKFGSADRFSDVKPHTAPSRMSKSDRFGSVMPNYFSTPGPGSYRV